MNEMAENPTEAAGSAAGEKLVLDDVQVRVLGALIEKSLTTPDQYPMTVNALKNACNQKTSRSPVVNYDDNTVRDALGWLENNELVRVRSSADSRLPKYLHNAGKALDLTFKELAIMGVLMLRGAQTSGEIRTRCARMHDFPDLAQVEGILERLRLREPQPLVVRFPPQPGQKEARFAHTLAGEPRAPEALPAATAVAAQAAPQEQRLAALEQQMSALRAEVDALRQQLDELLS